MGLARNEEAAKTLVHDDMDHENLLNKEFYIGLKDVSRSNTGAWGKTHFPLRNIGRLMIHEEISPQALCTAPRGGSESGSSCWIGQAGALGMPRMITHLCHGRLTRVVSRNAKPGHLEILVILVQVDGPSSPSVLCNLCIDIYRSSTYGVANQIWTQILRPEAFCNSTPSQFW